MSPSFGRGTMPMVVSQLNIRPVFDVHADVQGRDLRASPTAIDKVIAADKPGEQSAIAVNLAGQVQTMRESFSGSVRRDGTGGRARLSC